MPMNASSLDGCEFKEWGQASPGSKCTAHSGDQHELVILSRHQWPPMLKVKERDNHWIVSH